MTPARRVRSPSASANFDALGVFFGEVGPRPVPEPISPAPLLRSSPAGSIPVRLRPRRLSALTCGFARLMQAWCNPGGSDA